MSHQYKVEVIHDGRPVQVYPQRRESGADFQDVCTRIGMYVMAEHVTAITVYRDGVEYRRVMVAAGKAEQEVSA